MKAEARNEVRIGTRSTEEYKRSVGEELTLCDYSKTLYYTYYLFLLLPDRLGI
jgi:hypothetical protein